MPLPKSLELEILEHSLKFKKRFVACFDFLGFKQLTKTNPQKVIEIYAKTLRELQKDRDFKKISKGKILFTNYYFSDTFVLYTFSDSKEAFISLLLASKKFFEQALFKETLPLRGAFSYGELCTRKKYNILLGEALVDAYEYCESQNWIGFVASPSAIEMSNTYGYDGDSLWFRNVDVPFKKINGNCFEKSTKSLWAYAINAHPPINKRPLIDIIRDMKEKAPDKDKEKYDNTLKFITRTQYELSRP